mgnify:CR=1 FL=1
MTFGSPDSRRTSRAKPSRPEIGRAAGIGRDGVAKCFVLAAPHVRQADPVRAARGARVQVDRDVELIADPGADSSRDLDAGFHRHAANRHERDDVGRADPWVLALLDRHVNSAGRLLGAAEGRFGDRRRAAGERQHHPIVRGVGVQVENRDPRNGRRRVTNPGDHLGPPTFGEVRDALDELHTDSREIRPATTTAWQHYTWRPASDQTAAGW